MCEHVCGCGCVWNDVCVCVNIVGVGVCGMMYVCVNMCVGVGVCGMMYVCV